MLYSSCFRPPVKPTEAHNSHPSASSKGAEALMVQTDGKQSTAKSSELRNLLSAPISYLALKRLYSTCPVALAQLTADEKRMYAKILFKPSSLTNEVEHKKLVKTLIQGLPRYLQNPTPLTHLPQSYLTEAFHCAGVSRADLPPAAPLCSLHRNLNGQIVASILTAVEMHVEDFLSDLVAVVDRTALSPETQHLLTTVENLVAVWTTPYEFSQEFRRSPIDKWTFADFGGCDGCLLSHVGGSEPEILVALRAAALAATGSRLDLADEVGPPALEYFDCWISEYAPRQIQHMHRVSSRMAEEMMRLWQTERTTGPTSRQDAGGAVEQASSTPICKPVVTKDAAPLPVTTPPAPKRNFGRLRICPVPFMAMKGDPVPPQDQRRQSADMHIFDHYTEGSVIDLEQADRPRKGNPLHTRSSSAPSPGSPTPATPYTPRHWPRGSISRRSSGFTGRASAGLRSSPPPLTMDCLSESSGPSSPLLESSPSIMLSLSTLGQAYAGHPAKTPRAEGEGGGVREVDDGTKQGEMLYQECYSKPQSPRQQPASDYMASPATAAISKSRSQRAVSHRPSASIGSAVTFCANPTPPLNHKPYSAWA